jgi:hypothetical protein
MRIFFPRGSQTRAGEEPLDKLLHSVAFSAAAKAATAADNVGWKHVEGGKGGVESGREGEERGHDFAKKLDPLRRKG